jgi:hypothetical protein
MISSAQDDFESEILMATIPKALQPHINAAFPEHVCLVGSCLPSGYAQITPRGSVQVFDDDHLSMWERGRGATTAHLKDGTKLTIYFQNAALRPTLLPLGGIARLYGEATVHTEGPIYEEIWRRLIEPEKGRDPERKGFAVLIKIERCEDLSGAPLEI